MFIGFNTMNTAQDPLPQDLAKALEERNYESLWLGEHSHIPVARTSPYPPGGKMPEPYKNMRDPYVSMMAAAAATTRLKLGTGIALLMERDVFSQAKTIATLDQLSGGRTIIGTGVGWNEEEYSNVNPHPWNKRYAVLKETVAATRALWTHAEAEYHGQYVRFDKVWSFPKPAQLRGPKVLLGAMGPLGVKHAADWADGWMPVDVALGDVAQALAEFRSKVHDNGRNADDVDISIVTLNTPDLDTLKRYQDIGVRRVIIGVATDLWDKPDAIMPLVDEFAAYIPALA